MTDVNAPAMHALSRGPQATGRATRAVCRGHTSGPTLLLVLGTVSFWLSDFRPHLTQHRPAEVTPGAWLGLRLLRRLWSVPGPQKAISWPRTQKGQQVEFKVKGDQTQPGNQGGLPGEGRSLMMETGERRGKWK